ncbi:NAD-dependent epimerase/dehydratase family protein [Aspergillus fumigatus Af293]|uniref:UDP-galactose 4-epimerase, putative n=2 Tax=Aspergillus fumigatus TaxID=746128 RepID=Q4WA81_ASPFU|nr:UDP-galactose 4-epimerase, putative [Aspergillus fumigatus Af293]EAL84855.1 UDP-galactose 4-epimerase, putative [Aspergillus fumigatus Af293]
MDRIYRNVAFQLRPNLPLRIPTCSHSTRSISILTIHRPRITNFKSGVTKTQIGREYSLTTSEENMRIAITGARGSVGQFVVKLCADAGHSTVQINRTDTDYDGTPRSEMATADVANDYDACLKAFKNCDAVIHLASIPDPVDKPDHTVHNNNVNSAFNCFRAAAELGIKRFCYASSVNAVGLAYANQPLQFDYFPVDEDAPQRPTDAYALAKHEAEIQARSFATWFPGMKIACLRIHEVAPLKDVQKEHQEDWENAAVKQLWGWVSPQATARACLLAVERSDNFEGCQVFNIVAPTTTQDTPSEELAKKYYPGAEIRGDMSKNQSFFAVEKAQRILGWTHDEKE